MFEKIIEHLDDRINFKMIADKISDGIQINEEEKSFITGRLSGIEYYDFVDPFYMDKIVTIAKEIDLYELIHQKFNQRTLGSDHFKLLEQLGYGDLIEEFLDYKIPITFEGDKEAEYKYINERNIVYSKDKEKILKVVLAPSKFKQNSGLVNVLLYKDEISVEDIIQNREIILELYGTSDAEFEELVNVKQLIQDNDQEKIKEYIKNLDSNNKYKLFLLSKIEDKSWIKENYELFEEIIVDRIYDVEAERPLEASVVDYIKEELDIERFLQELSSIDFISLKRRDYVRNVFEVLKDDEKFKEACIRYAKTIDYSRCSEFNEEKKKTIEMILKATGDIGLVKDCVKKSNRLIHIDSVLPDSYLSSLSYEELLEENLIYEAIKSHPEKDSILKAYLLDERIELESKTYMLKESKQVYVDYREYDSILKARQEYDERKAKEKREDISYSAVDDDIVYRINPANGYESTYTPEQMIAISDKINEILRGIDIPEKGNEEQELSAFLTLCKRLSYIKYDYYAISKQGEKNQALQLSVRNLEGLVTGKSVCAGYAMIICELAPYLGIEARYISGGKKNKAGHAWNQVRIGDKWFNLDYTWSRDMIARDKVASPRILKTDKLFLLSHSHSTYPRSSKVGKEETCSHPLSSRSINYFRKDNNFLNYKKLVMRIIRHNRIPFSEVELRKNEIMEELKKQMDTNRVQETQNSFDEEELEM